MKRWVLVAALLIAACDKKAGMETRTFELGRLKNDEAIALLTPYIREGGYLSGKNNLITVREKADRLTLIDDLLKKYDGGGEAADIVMQIQVIEADGFTQRDSAIADVEQTLREMFKYQGYRLAGETLVRSREESIFEQNTGRFRIAGRTQRLRIAGKEQRIPISIELDGEAGTHLSSTVTATIGKPVVLGQSTAKGAIILVIRPTIAGT